MDAQSTYSSVLVAYYAGVATDLPVISPYARALARFPLATSIARSTLIQAFLTDPFLCAKLCGVANSIFFNHDHQTIFTLEDSFDRVGVQYARHLLLEAPQLPKDIDELQVGTYWAHCMAVAHCARQIAGLVNPPPFHPGVAYLVGMVHDIGYLLHVHYKPDRWGAVAQALKTDEPGHGTDVHARHGEDLARYWSLPTPAIEAIKMHHALPAGETCGSWLARVIAVSEVLLCVGRDDRQALHKMPSVCESMNMLGISVDDLLPVHLEGTRVYENCIEVASGVGAPSAAVRALPLRLVK
jgi:HD-like signal output (HDOD) protein